MKLAFVIASISVLSVLALILCSSPGSRREAILEDATIERMIARADIDVVSPENISKTERREYPFIKRYLASPDPDIRNVALVFLSQLRHSSAHKYLILGLHDPIASHRAIASQGILDLNPEGKTEELFSEIGSLNKNFMSVPSVAIVNLVLTIGNIGDVSSIEPLLALAAQCRMDDIRHAVRKATAKLGHEPSIEEIEADLRMGSPTEKRDALLDVGYFGDKEWVDRVAPLLQDESVAQSYDIGPNRVSNTVCDFAISTLVIIDTKHALPLKLMETFPYTPDQHKMMRELFEGDGSQP